MAIAAADIPPSYRAALQRIQAMASQAFSELQHALENARPTTEGTVLTTQIRKSLRSDIADLNDTINMLVSMAIDLEITQTTVESFANEAAAVVSLGKKASDRTTFEKRVITLLRAQAVTTSARASRLQREYENVFTSGRILSDIRPVFSSSASEPLGAIVMHNLKISYYGATGESRDMFFALDNADVAALKNVLERAELKASALERLINKGGIEPLDSKKE